MREERGEKRKEKGKKERKGREVGIEVKELFSFMELSQMIMRAGESKIHKPGWQAGTLDN